MTFSKILILILLLFFVQVRNEIDLVYGGDLRNNQNRVVFGQMLKYHKNSENFNVITKNKCKLHVSYISKNPIFH